MRRLEKAGKSHRSAPAYTAGDFSEMPPVRPMANSKLLRVIWIPNDGGSNHHNT
jgi:hypothetical protein